MMVAMRVFDRFSRKMEKMDQFYDWIWSGFIGAIFQFKLNYSLLQTMTALAAQDWTIVALFFFVLFAERTFVA